MTTKITRFLAALAIVAGVASLTAPLTSSAVTAKSSTDSETTVASSTSGSTPSGRITPKAIAAVPGYDVDRKDDDIVQLSNLRITDISYVMSVQGGPGSFAPGGPIAIVTASTEFGAGCARYQTEDSVRPVPCSDIASKLYSIHITDRTILLGVNRTRLTLDQMKVGDRVNAYGYLDRDGSFIDALILRDLDRPETPKAVQLENLLVTKVTLTPMLGSYTGTPYAIITAQTEPGQTESSTKCRLYPSTSPTVAMPCSTDILTREYAIRVSELTTLLSVNRKKITIDQIVAGHHINVYGNLNSDGSVDARILRDLDGSATPKTVQLENLRVFSVEKDASDGLNVLAGSNVGTCYEWSASSKRSLACPMGMSASAAAESDKAASESITLYRPTILYRIHVPATAQILDANRRKMLSRTINAGDTINVYGVMKGDTVIAEIVRITSSGPIVATDPPTLETITIKGGGSSTAYLERFWNISLAAGGGSLPYQWEVSRTGNLSNAPTDQKYTRGLPPGMRLTTDYPCDCEGGVSLDIATDPTQAWIAGTPTRTGVYVAKVSARDSKGRVGSTEVIITVTRLTR